MNILNRLLYIYDFLLAFDFRVFVLVLDRLLVEDSFRPIDWC